jgi:hypothetical protein
MSGKVDAHFEVQFIDLKDLIRYFTCAYNAIIKEMP